MVTVLFSLKFVPDIGELCTVLLSWVEDFRPALDECLFIRTNSIERNNRYNKDSNGYTLNCNKHYISLYNINSFIN